MILTVAFTFPNIGSVSIQNAKIHEANDRTASIETPLKYTCDPSACTPHRSLRRPSSSRSIGRRARLLLPTPNDELVSGGGEVRTYEKRERLHLRTSIPPTPNPVKGCGITHPGTTRRLSQSPRRRSGQRWQRDRRTRHGCRAGARRRGRRPAAARTRGCGRCRAWWGRCRDRP